MTEDLIISKDKDSSFRKACEACKIDFELIGEGQDGDKYRVTFEYPMDLFYLGRWMETDSRISDLKQHN